MVARDVLTNKKARLRLEAMLACIDSPRVEMVDPDELERLLAAMPQRQELRRGGLEGRARKKELAAFSLMRDRGDVFPGYSWQEVRSAGVHLYRTIAGQVRQASPRTRLALCLESPEVWRLVGDAVGPLRGRSFHCNCGPLSVPL